MPTRLLAVLYVLAAVLYVPVAILGLLGAVFVLNMYGGEGTTAIFQNIPMNLDSSVDLNDIQVSVHTPPEVQVNHPFTVTATIASQSPLSSLSGGGTVGRGRLDEILRPTAANTGSYALCLIVQIRLDDTSAFGLANTSGPFMHEQEFTVVPDVTTAQTAQWTVIPQDTFGVETIPHDVTVGVWFDAETTCSLGTPSLLGDDYYLVQSSPNDLPPAQFTVVNDDLRQQRAITAHLQPLAVAAVAVVTTASVGWAAGFFGWLPRRLGARRTQGASENVTQRRAAKRSWFTVVVHGGALLSIGLVLIALGPSTVVYYLGTAATLGSFFGGMVMAFVGIVFLAIGVRRIRFADSA
jgi:hypothetical protein